MYMWQWEEVQEVLYEGMKGKHLFQRHKRRVGLRGKGCLFGIDE
jgi:hypothetical protein